jgi:hypothetical protein
VFDPADFNEDGHVDGADLLRWKQSFGSQSNSLGDADGDLDADGTDFLLWQRQLTGPGVITTNAPVPEPSGWALALVAAAAGIAQHKSLRRLKR